MSTPPPAIRRLDAALLALLLLAAAALRFYAIDHSSLWSDEGNTWALVQRGFGAIAAAAAADIHPPGYYWLLRVWSLVFGTSAAAMRSFSALCGAALVGLTWLIARKVAPPNALRRLPLLAVLLAMLSPFQVFYSQEARMYMLLALESALLAWLVLLLMQAESEGATRRAWALAAAVALFAVAGLWTHYSFPIVLAAAAAGWFVVWLESGRKGGEFLRFAGACAAALLLFLPWLPTALRQVTTWPQGGEEISLGQGLQLTLSTLLAGGMRAAPTNLWPWGAFIMLLPLLGAFALRRSRVLWPLAAWLLAPVLLMFALGLFSDAFLKFLLVASTPWVILCAAAVESAGERAAPWLWAVLAGAAILLGAVTLPAYYTSPTARDNYAGVARWVAWQGSISGRETQMVLLNAPGQAEVWGYYDPGVEVLPIPAQRPPDAAQATAQLQAATANKETVHALFWATEESDPEGIVEGWLNRNLYKGMESWQGNVRYVEYQVGGDLPCSPHGATAGALTLLSLCIPEEREVVAGRPVLLELRWRAERTIPQAWKISVQMLDERGQVIAQQDGEPAGGSRPTSTWLPGEEVVDRHSLPVPLGTPPNAYNLALAVYDPTSGERLVFSGSDMLPLGQITVVRPDSPPPADLLPMQVQIDRPLGPVTLLGYAQYKAGFAYAPETPLVAGETLHLTLFWRAPSPLPADWPAEETVTITLGSARVSALLAGGGYASGAWQAGEIVRAEFDIPYDGSARRATLVVGKESVRLRPLPR